MHGFCRFPCFHTNIEQKKKKITLTSINTYSWEFKMGVLTLVDTKLNIVQSFDVRCSDLFLSHFHLEFRWWLFAIRGSTVTFKLKWFNYILYISVRYTCSMFNVQCSFSGCCMHVIFNREIFDDNTYTSNVHCTLYNVHFIDAIFIVIFVNECPLCTISYL